MTYTPGPAASIARGLPLVNPEPRRFLAIS